MVISVFGSTGSIGKQALEVAKSMGVTINVLAAGNDHETLLAQIIEHKPRFACLADPDAAAKLRKIAARLSPSVEILASSRNMEELAANEGGDRVLNAVVGSAGLGISLAALRSGRDLALANKESLVAAGHLMVTEATKSGALILPVDSEHSAVWQCMWSSRGARVERIILTASGGPLRGLKDLSGVTPDMALAHPTWSMGRKISIDSATLVNKALEVIEARWLFGVPAEKIQVVIHPQSIVHSAVEFSDGSVIAQMGCPDMKLPILAALSFPERASCPAPGHRKLELPVVAGLTFEEPDAETFPGVTLGHKALEAGGLASCAMSAANEAAVGLFLEGKLPFTAIPEFAREALKLASDHEDYTLEDVMTTDMLSRRYVESRCSDWRSYRS